MFTSIDWSVQTKWKKTIEFHKFMWCEPSQKIEMLKEIPKYYSLIELQNWQVKLWTVSTSLEKSKKTSSIKENHSKHFKILNFEHLSMIWTFTIRTMHKYILPKSILPIQRLKTLKTQDLCWFYSRKKLNCCNISFSKVSHMPLKTEWYYFLWADHLLLLCEKREN